MGSFAPPGRGYAYGETMPIFTASPLPSPAARLPHRRDDHRAPLLVRDPREVIAHPPRLPVRDGRAVDDRAAHVVGRAPLELGPRRADERRAVRVARAGLGGADRVPIEARRARR